MYNLSDAKDRARLFPVLVQKSKAFLNAARTRLREVREARGWTMEKAAEMIGVDVKTYQRWESGRNRPQLGHLVALVEAFGLKALASEEGMEFFAFLARLVVNDLPREQLLPSNMSSCPQSLPQHTHW